MVVCPPADGDSVALRQCQKSRPVLDSLPTRLAIIVRQHTCMLSGQCDVTLESRDRCFAAEMIRIIGVSASRWSMSTWHNSGKYSYRVKRKKTWVEVGNSSRRKLFGAPGYIRHYQCGTRIYEMREGIQIRCEARRCSRGDRDAAVERITEWGEVYGKVPKALPARSGVQPQPTNGFWCISNLKERCGDKK